MSAKRQRHIDDCRRQAIERMSSSAHGSAAREGMYYTEMFNYLFEQFEAGRTPTGIPAKKLEGWQAIGEYRKLRTAK